ncbi:MAG: hypothetical protein HY904_14845 [Deltaproteobacteria bacterium]|nr:hypothetical protein [Deltaproteobacteria bacterium]
MKPKGPVDPDEIISAALARAGKSVVDAGVLYDAAEALLQVGRPDLAATYASRSYGLAVLTEDRAGAARAMTLLVSRLGPDGRKVLRDL